VGGDSERTKDTPLPALRAKPDRPKCASEVARLNRIVTFSPILQSNNPGTVDDVIEAVRKGTGLDIAGADPYSALASGVTSSSYLGTAYVNGIEPHQRPFTLARG
jgi:hypothetical protein